MDHRTRIEGALELIFQDIEKLKEQFPEQAFTVDGRLVGDIKLGRLPLINDPLPA